jgi:hypothetical protein
MFRFRTECLPQLMASTSARVCARAGTTKPFQPGIGAVPDSVGVGAAGQRDLSIPYAPPNLRTRSSWAGLTFACAYS